MQDDLVLTIDIGSQSIRAILVDKKGNTVLFEQLKYDMPCLSSTVEGHAEQEPDFYYDRLCEVTKALKAKAIQENKEGLYNNIIAVSLTCIRETVLCLDKDHKPLKNIIVWMDQRRAKGKPKTNIFKKIIFRIVGMTESVDMLYKGSFCNWIMENEPELWEQTDKYVMLSSYMNYKLTGQLKDGQANQVGHIPFDYRHRRWMKRGLSRCIADIPMSKLVDLFPSPGIIGYINAETSDRSGIPEGLPLITTATDKACEALGLSVITPDKAAISLGTASTIQFCSSHYFEPSPFLPSYPSAMPGFYSSEYQLYRGYWNLTWFKNNFCDKEIEIAKEKGVCVESLLDETLKETPVGSAGLVFSPHLSPGIDNPFSRGMFFGISDHHKKNHFYRAIIEGIAFELYHAMLRMQRRSGQTIKELYIAGGGSVNDSVVQICCDIFGLPIKRVQTHEASAIGSSICAFMALDKFSSYSEAVENMVHDRDVFIPNKENHKVYTQIYHNVYKHIEKSNTIFFKHLKKLD